MAIKVHDMQAAARIEGAPWEEINGTLGALQGAAAASGLSQLAIARRMGFSDPQLLRDRLADEAMVKASWGDDDE